MKPWSMPQSSAHWPRYVPMVSAWNQASLMKPGMPSFLTPNAGIHHEWITSAAVMSTRTFVFTGTTSGLSTSSR